MFQAENYYQLALKHSEDKKKTVLEIPSANSLSLMMAN